MRQVYQAFVEAPDLKQTVGEAFKLDPGVIARRGRWQPLALARQIAFYLNLVTCPKPTIASVGRAYGFDHGTVGYARHAVLNRAETEPQTSAIIVRIMQKLNGRYFYRDTYEPPMQKRWEIFDLRPADSPGFVTAKREDGLQVTLHLGAIEIERQ